jgi:hypothetical protein
MQLWPSHGADVRSAAKSAKRVAIAASGKTRAGLDSLRVIHAAEKRPG